MIVFGKMKNVQIFLNALMLTINKLFVIKIHIVYGLLQYKIMVRVIQLLLLALIIHVLLGIVKL